MTLAEMRSQCRRKLNEAAATFFTDADIDASLNEGLSQIAEVSGYFERQAIIPMLENRMYYDLSHIVTYDFLAPNAVYNPNGRKWLTATDFREMDSAWRQWETQTGQPEKYLMRGNWILGVWPKPSVDVPAGLRLYYSGVPAALENETDTPGFDRERHHGIVDYAMSDLMTQIRETKKAEGYWQSFTVHAADLKRDVQNRISKARVDVL